MKWGNQSTRDKAAYNIKGMVLQFKCTYSGSHSLFIYSDAIHLCCIDLYVGYVHSNTQSIQFILTLKNQFQSF